MANKRQSEPKYGRNIFKGLQAAFKSIRKHPDYLLSKHPLAAHSDFREMVDKSPDPCEAMMLAEDGGQ